MSKYLIALAVLLCMVIVVFFLCACRVGGD